MKWLRTLIALSIVVFIPFGLMIWIRIHQSSGFASRELILYPLLFGGSSILIIYLLHTRFLGGRISELNSDSGTWGTDILWGLLLTVIYFVLFYLERLTLINVLSFRSNEELLGLMLDMRESPFLLILWFGPVLWIGVALYEELVRVFLLHTLWKFSGKTLWIALVIILSGVLIGLSHWSQGSYGIVTIGIKSVVAGIFYYRVRRLFPLVLAHVLYDGLQVSMLLLTYPR